MEELTREIKSRDRVKCYWTTDPNYNGYGDCLSFHNFIEKNNPKPDVIGSPKTITEKWNQEKRDCGLNGGVYYNVVFVIGNEYVGLDDIELFVGMEAERKHNNF